MATTPTSLRESRTRLASMMLVVFAIAFALTAATAHAATTAANFTATQLTYANGSAVQTCRGWGADADARGHLYTACAVLRDTNGDGQGDVGTPALYELDETGRVVGLGWLPAGYYFNDTFPVRDVGVSPDGRFAYVSVGPNTDDLGQHPELNPTTKQQMADGAKMGALVRLARQTDGSWAYDASWHAGPFLIGSDYWAARYVDIDARGRVYVSVNAYVYELSPTTGAIITSFGGAQTNGPGGPWIEGFEKPEGISVAADGASIYIVDQQHEFVQRWLRVGATDWTRDHSFLLGVPDLIGDYCGTNDHFQSPYDVATDGAGDVYVMDTSCQRVQRYTRTGSFVQTVWTNVGGDEMNHGFGVNWQGSVLLPIEERLLVRADPPAKPSEAPTPRPGCTDRRAPVITDVTAPASTTTRAVTIVVTATDDCSGVTGVRVVGAVLGRAVWSTTLMVQSRLSGWNGPHTLVVQVRDATGHVASRRVVVTLAFPQPPLHARTVVQVAGVGCSRVAPMRRVAGAGGYRLVDRCARLAGRVLSVRGAGTGTMLQVLVPVTAARAIYDNAVGPVKIWVIADAHTRIARRPRVGRGVVVVGSLVAQRDLAVTHAIPVDAIIGS